MTGSSVLKRRDCQTPEYRAGVIEPSTRSVAVAVNGTLGASDGPCHFK